MSISPFAELFMSYLEQARSARDTNQHHDQRRQLFLSFLDAAFGIKADDIEVEQYIQIAGKQVVTKGTARIKKGWIDAVFRDLIFEFKRDLERERADGLRELHGSSHFVVNPFPNLSLRDRARGGASAAQAQP